MLKEELMKAERAAAADGNWSESEEPSHSSADDEESLPLMKEKCTN